MFFEFISVNDFLKIPEPFGSVLKYFGLLNSLSDDLIEDNLKSHGDPGPIEVVVVIFTDFLYFRVGAFLL